ncbi:MAG: tRNA (adenosine(37)-N6)-dimethylallyltransferase MiaA [Acidaminococcaceae bacterium]
MKPKLVVILGPTATGKSNCGIRLAHKLGSEIISGDSMLVYRTMNIGTAKPTQEELAMVPHHLVNILPPEAEFNVVDFKMQAEKLITRINARGKIPVLVGGTGLYLKALLENYQFATIDESSALRQEWESFADANGNEALHSKLAELDVAAAERLHYNDRRRVIRAIETASGGEEVSQQRSASTYDAVVIGLRMPREVLYARINQRVEQMVKAGFFAEVQALLVQGVPSTAQAMKSIGYRQIAQYYDGTLSYEEAITKIKQVTRNFAKRQGTWYRKMPYIQWFDLPAQPSYDEVTEQMYQLLVEKFNLG